jgi:hypothetical protein
MAEDLGFGMTSPETLRSPMVRSESKRVGNVADVITCLKISGLGFGVRVSGFGFGV